MLTAVISIPAADHMLQKASTTLTTRPMPNFAVGPWTRACSHAAMSLTASGGSTPLHGRDLPLHHVRVGDEAVKRNHCRERRKKGEEGLKRGSGGEGRDIVLAHLSPRSRQDHPPACHIGLAGEKAIFHRSAAPRTLLTRSPKATKTRLRSQCG